MKSRLTQISDWIIKHTLELELVFLAVWVALAFFFLYSFGFLAALAFALVSIIIWLALL